MQEIWVVAVICLLVFIVMFLIQGSRIHSEEKKPAVSRYIGKSRRRELALPKVTAPGTARHAFEIIWSGVESYDAKSRLTGISSGNVLSDGRADCWDLFFDLPERMANVDALITIASDWDGNDPVTYVLVEKINPFPLNSPTEIPTKLRKSGSMPPKMILQRWQQELVAHSPLPHWFKDFTEAVEEMRSQGAPFVVCGTR